MPNPFAGPDGSTHGRPLKGINDDPMYETVEQEDDDEGRAFLAREAEKDARLRLAKDKALPGTVPLPWP